MCDLIGDTVPCPRFSLYGPLAARISAASPRWETGAPALILYRQVPVWGRISARKAVIYICFENLSTGLFCVQSADFFDAPMDPGQFDQHVRWMMDLFTDVDPHDRCGWFADLADAIAAHDDAFR